jgi:hypothetical protein
MEVGCMTSQKKLDLIARIKRYEDQLESAGDSVKREHKFAIRDKIEEMKQELAQMV